jgi:hypothetical protein
MRANFKMALMGGVCATALLVGQPEYANAQNLIVPPAEGGTYGAAQGQYSMWGNTQEVWTEDSDEGRVDEEQFGTTGAFKLGWAAPPGDDLAGWDFAVQFSGGLLDADGAASGVTDEPDHAFGSCDTGSTSAFGATCAMNDNVRWFMGDIEAGLDVGSGETRIRLFGGVRAGYFDFDRGHDYFWNSTDTPADLNQETTFLGAGPRLGVAFRTPLGANRNIQLMGGLAGGVLLGNRDTEVRADLDGDVHQQTESNFETVWNAEGELGLSADVGGGIMVDVGYRAEFWGNTINLPNPDGNVGTLHFDSEILDDMVEGDIFNHGPFLRVTYAFDVPNSSNTAARSAFSPPLPAAYPVETSPSGSQLLRTANAPTGGLQPGALETLSQQLERQQKLLDAQQEQIDAQRKQLETQQNLLNAQMERLDTLDQIRKAALD